MKIINKLKNEWLQNLNDDESNIHIVPKWSPQKSLKHSFKPVLNKKSKILSKIWDERDTENL